MVERIFSIFAARTMLIRNATVSDLPVIMTVLEAAKGIMRSSGNLHQWVDGYPSEHVIQDDIASGHGKVVTRDGSVVGYFAFIPSPEPTYSLIEGGEWLDDSMPYHVIHRIGSLPGEHGVMAAIMDYAFANDPNIRIDTHRDNAIMQHCITSHSFSYCGIIYLASGDERLAYQCLRPSSQKVAVRSFRELGAEDFYRIVLARSEVFILEQRITVCQELDEEDLHCLHVTMEAGGKVVAYARCYTGPDGTAHIGRVLTTERGRGLGAAVMRRTMMACRQELGARRIVLHSQVQVEGFYAHLGFRATGEHFDECGIEHVTMEYNI